MICPTPQMPDECWLDEFSAEFIVKVRKRTVISIELIFSETFDNECRLFFSLHSKLDVRKFSVNPEDDEGFFSYPSYMHFKSKADLIEFGFLFNDSQKDFSSNRRIDFVKSLWTLACLAVRPSKNGRNTCLEFNAELSAAMDSLAAIEWFSDVDVPSFSHLFFPSS